MEKDGKQEKNKLRGHVRRREPVPTLVGIHGCLRTRNRTHGPISGAVETYGVLPSFAGNSDTPVLAMQPGTSTSPFDHRLRSLL